MAEVTLPNCVQKKSWISQRNMNKKKRILANGITESGDLRKYGREVNNLLLEGLALLLAPSPLGLPIQITGNSTGEK